MWTLLLLHISSAVVGLLSGFLAMSLRKGSGWHGAAGNIFFVAMLSMSASAAFLSVFHKPNMLNTVVSLLTFYLVATAWWAARNRGGRLGIFDLGAFVVPVTGNIRQRLKIAQLHSAGICAERSRGFDEHGRSLLLAFRVDHLCASSPFRLSLFGHGADHGLVQIDMLDLDIRDLDALDAPNVGRLIEDALDVQIELVAARASRRARAGPTRSAASSGPADS